MTPETNTNMPFDADEFMQQTVDQPMETDYQLCPEGSYPAMIDDFTSEAFKHFSGTSERTGRDYAMTTLELPWSIQDATVLAGMGRDKVLVTQKIIVDRTEQGGLDWGKDKNVKLGQTRAALGQNGAGTWNFSNLKGAGPAMVQIKHIGFERKDGTKGKRAEVVRVAPIRT